MHCISTRKSHCNGNDSTFLLLVSNSSDKSYFCHNFSPLARVARVLLACTVPLLSFHLVPLDLVETFAISLLNIWQTFSAPTISSFPRSHSEGCNMKGFDWVPPKPPWLPISSSNAATSSFS